MAHRTPDLLIVGGGPAGISAALWAASLDLSPRVLEASARTGGQLHRIHFEPANLAGSQPGDGAALAARAAAQVEEARIDVRLEARAVALEILPDGTPSVRSSDGVRHHAPAIVIATGLRPRRLGIPGEAEFAGRGVSDSATRDLEQLRGSDVTVIGGGDAAFENALLLANAGCRVTLAVRGPVHARASFRERAAERPSIVLLHEANALAILGDRDVRAVRFSTPAGEIEHAASAVVIKVGQQPNSEWCRDAVACDSDGYIKVDATLGTSKPGIRAIGDVARPPVPGIAIALGHGASVAAAIRKDQPER